MKQKPEISVIVPIYGVEQYLPQCIDSILVQTFENFELLLIDDGSPDRSGEICDDYALKDERIRVFHQKNAGLSCARNVGIKAAEGKYISFIDSDDYVKSDYLYDLYKALPSHGRGVVVGGFERIFPDKTLPYCVPEALLYPQDFYRLVTEFIDKRVMYAWSKLFCKELIDSNGIMFVPNVSGLEDMLFVLDYCLHADYVLMKNLSNYCYRVNYSSETLSSRINSYQSEVLAYREFVKRLKLYQDYFGLADKDLDQSWQSLTIFFHKVILSLYSKSNQYPYAERVVNLRELLSNDKANIQKYFLPAYVADKIGKYILLCGGSISFDIWMRFLYGIKFKKMFGVK